MLSKKEIADYVHGRVGSAGKEQFTFSGVTKLGDALIMRWHTLTGFTEGEPTLSGKIAPSVKSKGMRNVLSGLRIRALGKMSTLRRNSLLIILFLVVFAAMFVLESRHSPARTTQAFSRSNSTVEHKAVQIYD